MGNMKLEVPHQVGRDEARRRLQTRLEEAKREMAGRPVSLDEERWEGDSLIFRLQAFGMGVQGSATADDDHVRVEAKLPLAAMMMRGTIESQLRAELERILT